MSRAVAISNGVDPSRLGSFKDELLREMDERQRNCRYAEMTLLLNTMLLVWGKKEHGPIIDEWLTMYEAELYQDVYTPEHDLKERAALQRKRAEQKKELADKARLLKKVAEFG